MIFQGEEGADRKAQEYWNFWRGYSLDYCIIHPSGVAAWLYPLLGAWWLLRGLSTRQCAYFFMKSTIASISSGFTASLGLLYVNSCNCIFSLSHCLST